MAQFSADSSDFPLKNSGAIAHSLQLDVFLQSMNPPIVWEFLGQFCDCANLGPSQCARFLKGLMNLVSKVLIRQHGRSGRFPRTIPIRTLALRTNRRLLFDVPRNPLV